MLRRWWRRWRSFGLEKLGLFGVPDGEAGREFVSFWRRLVEIRSVTS